MSKDEKVRVLVVDDEVTVRSVLRMALLGQGYEVSEASSIKEANELIKVSHPQLLLLDLGLPDGHGRDLVRQVRSWTKTPIIVLTVDDSERSKIALLDAGADDYLTKPFSTGELLARVRAHLRSHDYIEATPIFKSGIIYVDLNLRIVKKDDQVVKLTNTEFELLTLLVRESGKVVSQKTLLNKMWASAGEDQTHYLRIYIKQLRKKLEESPSKPQHILTEPGVGYRLI